jgi:hypothetical protein
MSRAILLISRLLSNQHNLCLRWPFSKHCLGRHLPKIAGFALTGSVTKLGNGLETITMDGVICHTGRLRRRFGDDLHERMLSKLTGEARRGVKQLRGFSSISPRERSITELIYDAVEKYKVCLPKRGGRILRQQIASATTRHPLIPR